MNKLKELFDFENYSTGRFVYLSMLVLSMYIILFFPVTRALLHTIIQCIVYLSLPAIFLREFIKCLEFFIGRVKKWKNKN